MTANTITIADLAALEHQTTMTSLAIRKIKIAAERSDITPAQAARQLRTLGIFIRPKSDKP